MNVKLSTSQLDKWKSEIKNNAKLKFHQMLSVILMIKIIKLSLTNTHVSRLRKAFANNFSEERRRKTRNLYVKDNHVTYFDSFGIEQISKKTEKFRGNKCYHKYL